MSDNTPGWQTDPTGKHDHRYWDGSQWTDNVSNAGVASTDAYASAADAPVDPTVVAPAPPAPDATASWPTTPGAPAAPPPYVPTKPVSSGAGGSKKGLLVGGAILAAVAIAVVAFLALGGDDDEEKKTDNASSTEDTTGTTDTTEGSSDGGGSGGLTDGSDLPNGFEDLLADTYEETFNLSRDKAECLAGRLATAIEDGTLDEEQAMTEFFDFLTDCDISMEEIGAN